MQNPFESGHIKNYLLLYASVVVIMVLFFIASSLFLDQKKVDKKLFNKDSNNTQLNIQKTQQEQENHLKFKLLKPL